MTIKGAPGWVDVHVDEKGEPGRVVGHAATTEGTTKDLVVKLDSKVASGAFWPMLHVDAGTGHLRVPWRADVGLVEKKITLTLQ